MSSCALASWATQTVAYMLRFTAAAMTAWSCLLTLLLCSLPGAAIAAAPDRIEALAPGARLTGEVTYLIDNSRQLGIAQVRDASAQSAFRRPETPLRNLYDDRPYWIRVVMQQEGDRGDRTG